MSLGMDQWPDTRIARRTMSGSSLPLTLVVHSQPCQQEYVACHIGENVEQVPVPKKELVEWGPDQADF